MSDETPPSDELPPPVLGRWRNLYLLEVVVLVLLIAAFVLIGEIYR